MKYSKDISIYNWFVDTLREAYENDTLEAGSPCRCGVGNCIDKKYTEIHGHIPTVSASVMLQHWTECFCTTNADSLNGFLMFGAGDYVKIREEDDMVQFKRKKEDLVGEEILRWFSVPRQVLMDLEWAFETNQTGKSKDEKMFSGLMACIRVLDEYFEVPAVVQVKTHCDFATASVNK